MSVKSLLLWEKWRPKNIDEVILLPRIRKQFENGISQHCILYGHYGTGKTSLARILIGKYTKETPCLELNCSMDTSIDILREEIQNFCKFTPMMETESDIKYVFLDEFERVSIQFQDAFKAFIEKYNKNVRFIITTNHLNKISDGIKSRIPQINFDCQSLEEEKLINESTVVKIIGLTLETRPDQINETTIKQFLNYGCTRIQLGVQHTDDRILKKINRQCYLKDTIRALRNLKDSCFKVDIHIMPQLPDATVEDDIKMFKMINDDPDLQADQLKIYPCETTPWTKIEK